MEAITAKQYRELVDKKSKPSKYRNKVIVANEKRYDSKKEYERYMKLLMMQRGGYIHNLRSQVRYVLRVNGHVVCAYIADFVYEKIELGTCTSAGETIIEDVKSEITRKNPVYRLKKKLMKAVYNIDISEI